jgi:N-acetylmuramoyl-L-alanine amidase
LLFKILICLLTLGTLALQNTPAQAETLDIRDVRFGVQSDKTRLVLDLSKPSNFRAFVLGDPVRLVIDLPEFTWSLGAVTNARKAGITAVRHGTLNTGTSRIVFDVGQTVSIQNAFVLLANDSKPDRLVIDFSKVNAQTFTQNKNIVFGNLEHSQVLDNRPLQNQGAPPPPQPDSRTTSLQVRPVPLPQDKPEPLMDKPLKKPLIIIDPGHGGIDPGAIATNGLQEKDIVLSLAKALKKELEQSGQYRVLMTREKDVFIKLADRVKFAREAEGDLFISVHADSVGNPDVRGASLYTLSEKASDAQTEKLAARENKADLIAGIDLSVEDQDVANILVDLAMRDTMNQSKFLAGKLVKTLPSNGLNLLERPHRSAGFAVLKAPDIPSILIEAGFMSNNTEAKRLNTPEHRSRFAKSLHRGIDAYFEQVRKNQRL